MENKDIKQDIKEGENMKKCNGKKNCLVPAIIFASVIIAGAMVYLGMQMSGSAQMGAEEFDKQIEAYAQRQEAKARQAEDDKLNERNEQAKNVAPINDSDHVYGDRGAEITIFEYSDFECPFCKRFAKTPKAVVDGSGGKVNTIFRHFPLGFHEPLATKQAIASECAAELGGDKMFWKYHEKIFAATKSNGKGMKESQLYTIAADLGLNAAKFKDCIASGKRDQKVTDDIASGAAAGVTGTPGVIIKNNKTGEVRVMPGAVPIESVQAAVTELLK